MRVLLAGVGSTICVPAVLSIRGVVVASSWLRGSPVFVGCAPRLQVDFPGVRVSAVHPSSLNTAIFAKAGDRRDVSHKPGPDVAAGCFHFMLQLPSTVEVHDIVLMNRASMPRFSPTPPPVSA